MKSKITTILIAILLISVTQTMAQSGQITGTSTGLGDLYHEYTDLGVGSTNGPKARIHIFNRDVYLEPQEGQYYYKATFRPFLITGKIFPVPIPGELQKPVKASNFFTVNKLGKVGINVLDPYTKLHLNSGIFTFSTGSVTNPSANWQLHGNSSAFAIKDELENRYRFWINKGDGFVGIGTESPEEKLHIKDGILKIETSSGSTSIGSLNAGFTHFTTTLPKFYFNKSIHVNGVLNSYQADLLLQANGTTGIKVLQNGKVNIGTTTLTAGAHTDYKLSVDGKIVSKKVVVTLDNWADNVFDADYELKTLAEVEAFIAKEKHLPEIPSEAEVMENGVELGEINMLLLKKVEELTLYMIEMQKEIDDLKTAK